MFFNGMWQHINDTGTHGNLSEALYNSKPSINLIYIPILPHKYIKSYKHNSSGYPPTTPKKKKKRKKRKFKQMDKHFFVSILNLKISQRNDIHNISSSSNGLRKCQDINQRSKYKKNISNHDQTKGRCGKPNPQTFVSAEWNFKVTAIL